jgi:DNA modification methylase
MGSGTTAAVAIKNRRQYLGCELNHEYQSLQQERITAEEKIIKVEDNQTTLEEFFN